MPKKGAHVPLSSIKYPIATPCSPLRRKGPERAAQHNVVAEDCLFHESQYSKFEVIPHEKIYVQKPVYPETSHIEECKGSKISEKNSQNHNPASPGLLNLAENLRFNLHVYVIRTSDSEI